MGCGLSRNTWHVRLSSDMLPTGFTQGPAWGRGGAQGEGWPPACLSPRPPSSVSLPGQALRVPKLETFEAVVRLWPKSDPRSLRCDFLHSSATRWELPVPQNKAACRGYHHPQVEACRGVARDLRETVASEGPCHLGELALSLSGGAWRRVCAPRQCWSLFSCVSRKGVQSAQWGGQAPVSISPRLPWASARTSSRTHGPAGHTPGVDPFMCCHQVPP